MHAHLDYFERQLSTESDQQGERFHQVTMPMESRYKGKKIDSMIADICWWLKVAGDDTDDGKEFNNEVSNDETEESGSEESNF